MKLHNVVSTPIATKSLKIYLIPSQIRIVICHSSIRGGTNDLLLPSTQTIPGRERLFHQANKNTLASVKPT